jgi:RHS repeat-associated protein
MSGDVLTIYVRDATGNVMSVYEKNGGDSVRLAESHLYGSSRLGIEGKLTVRPVLLSLEGSAIPGKISTFTRGEKFFELSNHLGNVLVTVTDKKIQVGSSTAIDYYAADITSANDYYPFGMLQPGRSYNTDGYRYGFNGKENDNDVKGEGNQQDYGMRIYDPRLGRFLSVDPITMKYPELTPYQFASNRPIQGSDLDGLEFNNRASALEHWMRTAPLQTITREFPQTAPQAAHKTPVTVIPGSSNTGLPQREKHIAEADMYGNGHIGPESVVKENIASIKSSYYAAIGANIAGGAFGAAGYYLGGDNGSRVGAVADGVSTAFVGVPGGGYLSRPRGMTPEMYVPNTEATTNMQQSAYAGIRSASNFLQQQGVSRAYRTQILQSFEAETVSLKTADNATFGLRFYGGAAGQKGRYLFPTFTEYTNREGLALPPSWNSMIGVSQFQVAPGTTYIYGRAASQGGSYTGGSYQMYINNVINLDKVNP